MIYIQKMSTAPIQPRFIRCGAYSRSHGRGLYGILLNIPHPEARLELMFGTRAGMPGEAYGWCSQWVGAGNGLVRATGWCWQWAGAGNGLVMLGDVLVMPGNVGDCVE